MMRRLLLFLTFTLLVVTHESARARVLPLSTALLRPGILPASLLPATATTSSPGRLDYRGVPPNYGAPPSYSSANCGTPDQFKPCYR